MHSPLAAIDFSSHQAALFAGGAALIALAVGIAANLVDERRLGTNSKAALSVVYALLAGVALLVGGALRQLEILDSPFLFAGPVALLLVITGICFAVNGLEEIRHFRDRWPRGRRRALAVLIAPVVLALAIVATVVAHLSGHPIFGSLVGGTAGSTVIDTARNFRLDAPPPWVQTDAPKDRASTAAAFARQGPAMRSSMEVAPLPSGVDAPFDSAVEAIKDQISRGLQGQILTAVDEAENGNAGCRIESLVSLGDDRQFQVHWVTQDGRNVFHLQVSGAQEDRETISVEARKLAAGFRLLDPHPVVNRAPAPVAITFTSPKFGYSVDLTKTVWTRPWANLEKEMPCAEFGALNTRASAAFCVIPVWIGDDELDLDILSQALSIRVGVPFVRESLFSIRSFRQGPLQGRSYAFEQTQNEVQLLYRIRVLRGRGFAYLLAAWMNKAVEPSSEFLDLAMDCVTFPEQAARDPLILGDRPRATHALVWNDIGGALFQQGKFEAALPWFQRAVVVDKTSAQGVVNYTETSLKLNRGPQALIFLDEHQADFPGNPAIAACKAATLLQTGDTAGGMRAYRELFAAGWRDDGHFTRYLSTLAGQRRFDEALTALDQYASGHDSAPLRSLRTQILALRDHKP